MSRKLRFAAVGVGLLIIIVAAWFLLLSPLREEIATLETSIETEQANLATAQAKLAQAEVTKAEGKQNQARLLELAKMVPFSAEVPSLLLQIQDLADQSGIEFTSVTPGDELDAGDFRILPLSLEFTGTFFDLSDFVFRAEQLVAGPGRLLAVKQVDLALLGEAAGTGGEGGSPLLKVSMMVYAFESSTAAAAAAAQADTAQASGSGATDSSGGSGS